jgi:hypothetical protein
MVPREAVFGKALIDDATDALPRRLDGVIGEGLDQRYAYANFPAQDPGSATSIQVLVSDGRSMDADVDDIDSTGTKHSTSSGTHLDTVKMQRVATLSDYHPNAIVGLPAFGQLVDRDMRSAIREALDAYVLGVLAGGAGTTDNPGGSDLLENIRKAQTVIQAAGFDPSLVLISPDDAEDLDLNRTLSGDGPFLLPPSPRDTGASPLWRAKVVVCKSVTDPFVMDPSAVEFYLGNLAFASDPISKFDSNESRFRLEGPTLAVARQPDAIYEIVTGS